MVALRQLALPEVAGQQRVAVTIHAIGEVLARHANDATLPALQLGFVEEIPLLHGSPNFGLRIGHATQYLDALSVETGIPVSKRSPQLSESR